ncbi:MAG: hypothetical protein ACOYL7_16580 [Caldilinea sp.]
MATRKRTGGLGENSAFTTPSESSPIRPEEETPELNEAAEVVVEEGGPAAAETTAAVTEAAETKNVHPGHGLHLPNLKELKMPELGEIKMPNLGEVKMPNLGEVKMPNLGEVKMPNLGEVKMPNLGEVKMPDLGAMRAQGEANVRHWVDAGTEKSSAAARWGVTAGAALAGGVVGVVLAKGMAVGGISLLAPSVVALTGVVAGGLLGWRGMRPGQSGAQVPPAEAVATEKVEGAASEPLAA